MNSLSAKSSRSVFESAALVVAGFVIAALANWRLVEPTLASSAKPLSLVAQLTGESLVLLGLKATLLGLALAVPYRLLVRSFPVKAWGKSSPSV